MKNDYLLEVENRLQGLHTRLAELHFSTSPISIHKLIDEFSGNLREFEDEIMEDAQSIHGLIEPGELEPILPESMDFIDLLGEVRGMLAGMKDELSGKMYTGIINCVDEFWHTTNKTIYLVMLENK